MFERIKSFFQRPKRPNNTVVFDEEVVIRTLPDGSTESVRWDDLQRVAIQTTDQGPGIEDVWWILFGAEGGCLVPQGADGTQDLLEGMQERLPGFDNQTICEAMGCTHNAVFEVWSRGAEGG